MSSLPEVCPIRRELPRPVRELLDLGLAVFPLSPGSKQPYKGTGGFKDATTDRTQLARWADDANIGVRCGSISAIWVLDLDVCRAQNIDGRATLAELEVQHGSVPGSWRVSTPRGGLHVYFKHPGQRVPPRINLRPGIDVRGDDSYVVAPDSRCEDGEWRWIEGCRPGQTQLADAPPWLLDLVMRAEPATTSPPLPGASTGQRSAHDNLVLQSVALARAGQPISVIVAALEAHLGLYPSTTGRVVARGEIERIAQTAVQKFAPELKADVSPYPAMGGDEIEAAELAPPDVLFPGVSHPSTVLIVGEPGASKTLTIEALALQIASGLPLFGQWATPPRRVLLQIEEDATTLTLRRMKRLMVGMGVTPEMLGDRLKLLCRSKFFASNDEDLARIEATLKAHGTELWILDSITQCSGIQKQADAVMVRDFFRTKMEPIAERLNLSLWITHHVNKAGYAKVQLVEDAGLVSGSIQFNAAVDTVLLIRKSKQSPETRVLTYAKVRDAGDDLQGIKYRFCDDRWGPLVSGRPPLQLVFEGEAQREEVARAMRHQTVQDRAWDVLEADKGMRFTVPRMMATLGAQERSVRDALRALADEGKVRRTEGAKGVPAEYWVEVE